MIEVKGLEIQVGQFRLSDISFRVESGQYGILMGRTGSGKSTVMETICGLKQQSAGSIRLHGEEVASQPAATRGVGFVPQDGALFATMTVREHLGFALQIRKRPKKEIEETVQEFASMMGIEHLLDRRPYGLSGGEAQRVALGRALAMRPKVLCLDEPLSALDEETHGDMCRLLKSAQQTTGVTALHVTHSPREADMLGDMVFRIEKGAIHRVEPTQREGKPEIPQ